MATATADKFDEGQRKFPISAVPMMCCNFDYDHRL